MVSKADRKKKKSKKTSTARRRAETHTGGGGEFSTLTMPEGMNFFKAKPGIATLDIIPFEAGKGNPYADEGELHYERTYYSHPRMGAASKAYVCPAKTANKKCAFCEEAQRLGSDPDADDSVRKSLIAKQRQFFLVYHHEESDKGLQLWDFSYFNFGKLLDTRVRNSDDDDGYDLFYYPDTDGMTLKIQFEETKSPYGSFTEAKVIDFKRRKKDVPQAIVDASVCLDDILTIEPYAKLLAVLEGEDDAAEGDDDEKPKKKSSKSKPAKKSGKKKPEPEEEEEDDEEEEEDDDVEQDAEWLLAQGSEADDDDESAVEALTDRAEAVDLDPDDFKTYTKLAKAIIKAEAEEEEEEDEEDEPAPKKKSSKKGKKKEPEPKEEEEDDEDWDDEPEDEESEEEEEEEEDDEDWDDEEDEPAPKKSSKKGEKSRR